LLFVGITTDPGRQFEFIQQQWCNDGSRLSVGNDRDPLIGAPEPSARFVVQGQPPKIVGGLQRFVTIRAGEYFLLPGLRGLRAVLAG
jgi:hypothetical protein